MNTSTMKTLFSSDKNYWETPQALFNKLDEKYHFTLDAAASDDNHKCEKYFTESDDGLKQNWGGKRSSAILHTAIKRLASGQRSVMRSLRNQEPPLCC